MTPTAMTTPTATPVSAALSAAAQLPATGGLPNGESRFPWLVTIAAGLAVMAIGAAWLRRVRRT
jgi:hypothetical protein